jgi:magnesium chelatase family protein
MNSKLIRKFCKLDKECAEKLMEAMNRFNLSARAHDRILKVNSTIANLEGTEHIEMKHLVQGIQYRSLDRDFWSI